MRWIFLTVQDKVRMRAKREQVDRHLGGGDASPTMHARSDHQKERGQGICESRPVHRQSGGIPTEERSRPGERDLFHPRKREKTRTLDDGSHMVLQVREIKKQDRHPGDAGANLSGENNGNISSAYVAGNYIVAPPQSQQRGFGFGGSVVLGF